MYQFNARGGGSAARGIPFERCRGHGRNNDVDRRVNMGGGRVDGKDGGNNQSMLVDQVTLNNKRNNETEGCEDSKEDSRDSMKKKQRESRVPQIWWRLLDSPAWTNELPDL